MPIVDINGTNVEFPDSLLPEELEKAVKSAASQIGPNGSAGKASAMVTANAPTKSMLGSLGESLLPPGVSMASGTPQIDPDSAARALKPAAGSYGLGAAMETAGGMVQKAVSPFVERGENAYAESKVAQNFPKTTAFVGALPATLAEAATGMLKPSQVQQDIGTSAMGMAASEMASPLIKQYGRTIHRIPKKATERALENPAIMEEEFVNPSKLDEITSGLKNTLHSAKAKINQMYENFFGKVKSGKRAGVASPDPISQAMDKSATKMGMKIDSKTGEYLRGKGTSTKATDAEIAKLNDIRTKFAEDLKGTKTRKLTADKLHNQRLYLDSQIDYKTQSDFFNSELKKLRHEVDGVMRKNYPEVKELDGKFIKVRRAEDIVKRRTGIKTNQEIGDAELQKTHRLAKTLETDTGQVVGRELENRLGQVGGEGPMNALNDVAASSAFNRAIETNSPMLFKGAAAASRFGLKGAIRTANFLPGMMATLAHPLNAGARVLRKMDKKK